MARKKGSKGRTVEQRSPAIIAGLVPGINITGLIVIGGMDQPCELIGAMQDDIKTDRFLSLTQTDCNGLVFIDLVDPRGEKRLFQIEELEEGSIEDFLQHMQERRQFDQDEDEEPFLPDMITDGKEGLNREVLFDEVFTELADLLECGYSHNGIVVYVSEVERGDYINDKEDAGCAGKRKPTNPLAEPDRDCPTS